MAARSLSCRHTHRGTSLPRDTRWRRRYAPLISREECNGYRARESEVLAAQFCQPLLLFVAHVAIVASIASARITHHHHGHLGSRRNSTMSPLSQRNVTTES